MACIFRFPSALRATATLAAALALGIVPGVHAQHQPQPPEASKTATLPSIEAPLNTQTKRPRTPAPARKLQLPATFAGVLPCADCAGTESTLALQSDGSYHLRRTYLGKGDAQMAQSGRWTTDQNGKRLALHGSGKSACAYFRVQPDGSLHALDTQGRPYPSRANLSLRRMAQLDPAIKTAPLPSSTRAKPETLTAQTAESLERPGSGSTAHTPADQPVARLQDTYWKLVALQGQPASMLPGQEREVRITLGSENRQVQGFTGCNSVSGHYTLEQEAALKFDALASTRKMCAPAPNALEREVLGVLSATTSYRIHGEQLMLLGGGRVLARFEAVYLH